MDKTKIKEELGTLITQGLYIYTASFEDYDKNFYKKAPEEIKEYAKESAEKVEQPKRAYYDWYHRAIHFLRIFAPERLEEFEKYYTGDTTVKNIEGLNLITAGTSHYIQDWVIIKGDETKDFFEVFQSKFTAQRYILMAIFEHIDNPLFNLEKNIHLRIYTSELEVAKELQKEGHLRSAGAIAGVVIEAHLKKVATNRDIKIKKNPKMKDYNEALKDKAYDATIRKQIELCSIIRNKCAHAGDNPPNNNEINTIISSAEIIIATVS